MLGCWEARHKLQVSGMLEHHGLLLSTALLLLSWHVHQGLFIASHVQTVKMN